jgi:transposase
MPQVDDLSRSLVAFDQDATLIVVVEMSGASWLVAGMAPGVDRQPLKKLGPDPDALLRLVERWRDAAVKVGKMIERIALAFEAGRDGFWLARWLQARGWKCPSSIQPASRCRARIAGRRLTGWTRRC